MRGAGGRHVVSTPAEADLSLLYDAKGRCEACAGELKPGRGGLDDADESRPVQRSGREQVQPVAAAPLGFHRLLSRRSTSTGTPDGGIGAAQVDSTPLG